MLSSVQPWEDRSREVDADTQKLGGPLSDAYSLLGADSGDVGNTEVGGVWLRVCRLW